MEPTVEIPIELARRIAAILDQVVSLDEDGIWSETQEKAFALISDEFTERLDRAVTDLSAVLAGAATAKASP